jgi:hypothetical protein
METVANRALMARACEAVTLGPDVSGHLVPSVLGLMHQAAVDSRTSPSQAAAVRQFGGHFGQPHSGYTARALDPPASSSAARSSPASRAVEAAAVQGDRGRVVYSARGRTAPAGEPWRGPRSISPSSGQVPQQWEFEQPFPVRQARHARQARHNGRRPACADRDAPAGRPDRVASDPGPRRERQQR